MSTYQARELRVHAPGRRPFWQLDGAEATRSYYERPLQLLGNLRARRFEVAAEALAEAGVPAEAGRVPA